MRYRVKLITADQTKASAIVHVGLGTINPKDNAVKTVEEVTGVRKYARAEVKEIH